MSDGLVIGAIFLFLISFVFYIANESDKKTIACEARGGVMIRAYKGPICVHNLNIVK